jgi:hypothetical protein
VSPIWSKLCHSTSETFDAGASTRLPVSRSRATTLLALLAAFRLVAPVVALVDQTGVPDWRSSRTRSPWGAMVSREDAGSETGLSRLATQTGDRTAMLLYQMPTYERPATPPSAEDRIVNICHVHSGAVYTIVHRCDVLAVQVHTVRVDS